MREKQRQQNGTDGLCEGSGVGTGKRKYAPQWMQVTRIVADMVNLDWLLRDATHAARPLGKKQYVSGDFFRNLCALFLVHLNRIVNSTVQ